MVSVATMTTQSYKSTIIALITNKKHELQVELKECSDTCERQADWHSESGERIMSIKSEIETLDWVLEQL